MNEALEGFSQDPSTSEQLQLDQLIRHCADCFESDPPEPESKFPEWFFCVVEWLCTDVSNIMVLFVTLFQENPSDYGLKICSAVSFWIRLYPMHFDANPRLCHYLATLKQLASTDERIPGQMLEELDVSTIPSFAWLRTPSTRNPSVCKHISLCFEHWTAEDIAITMSHIDYKALCRVNVNELKHYVRSGRLSTPDTVHLERSIAIFNCFSGWVQATILGKKTATERAIVIRKFLDVAKHLRRLNNFNTLMALVGGLTHSNISRLSNTQAQLGTEQSSDLEAFTQLLSFSNNYAKYRRTLRDIEKQCFRMPIMGVHLKDLIVFWHSSGLEHFDKTHRISERCIGQLSFLLSHFLAVNRKTPNLGEPNLDQINTLKYCLLDIVYDEQELYSLSLKHEPKGQHDDGNNQKLQQPSIVADWAKGVVYQEPDPKSVDKHIKQMVNAIFKHYDDDHDGYIGKNQFEEFVSNFSFLEPLGPLETEQLGDRINRDDIEKFFKSWKTRFSRFKNEANTHTAGHVWISFHFLAPAICGLCNKMLWMRHGIRCRRCSMGAHDVCGPNISLECAKKSSIASNYQDAAKSGGQIATPDSRSPGLSWLNATLSPRFAPFVTGSSSRMAATSQQQANGFESKWSVQKIPLQKEIRRMRTSSSGTSDDSRADCAQHHNKILHTARDARTTQNLFFNSGVLRSSFHRLLRRNVDKEETQRTSASSSENTKCHNRSESASVEHREHTPRASLASEEVFEEDFSDSKGIQNERKGNG